MPNDSTTPLKTDPDATKFTTGLTTGPTAVTEDTFRRLVEGVKEYGIFLLDPKGFVMTWNEGAESIKGYKKEEIVGQHFSRFYLPEAVKSGWPTRELEMATETGRFADEGWRVKKDGSSFWASVSISAIHDTDGTLIGFAKVTRDLTDRRKAEERIQDLNRQLRGRVDELAAAQWAIELRSLELQRLSAQLLRAQDEERHRIARELHDDLGQRLFLLSATLGAIPPDNSQKKKISEAIEMAESAQKTVRDLSYLLHPPLLDEVGLGGALRWYVEGFTKRGGLKVSLSLQPPSLPRMSSDVEMTIFRIVQEALTNAYRHSGSENARVDVQIQGELALVQVRDYGKGLPEELLAEGRRAPKSFGVGLGGMRERVRQIGGELILSRAEPGTRIEARIPLFGAAV